MGIIFISHASQDEEIAEFFVDSLRLLGVDEKDIFFSARTHMGVGIGNRFPEVVSQKLHESSIIIMLLTKNYYASYHCQQEEGVAWYTMKEKRIIPIRIGISPEDMKGFIDKTVIATKPHEDDLRNIPYILKELGFIEVIPKDKTQFETFVKRCSDYNYDNIPDYISDIVPDKPKIQFTEDDMILLNYFLENKLRLLVKHHNNVNKKLSLEEYAANYPDFDPELSVKCFVNSHWIEINDDKDYFLNEKIFDMINTDAELKSKIQQVANERKKKKTPLESLILKKKLPEEVLMMLNYVRHNKVTELGDRWMAATTIDSVKSWENANHLHHTLSENYFTALKYMIDNRWVYVKEITSYGNPRLYGINKDVLTQLNDLTGESKTYLDDVLSQQHLT